MKLQGKSSQGIAVTLAVFVAMTVMAQVSPAQEAVGTFRQSCMSCHTVGGGRLVGPDLKNVEERQNREWLVGFIMDPKGVLAGGDPYALQLKDDPAECEAYLDFSVASLSET